MEVVILAAGKGTRMNSSTPKVLHSIGGKPMLSHAIDAVTELESNMIHVVVGYGAELIERYCEDNVAEASLNFVTQAEQLGTGHAVQQAIPSLTSIDDSNIVLILYGDVPLIQADTLEALLNKASANSIALLTAFTEDPAGLGRILRDGTGEVLAIVEEKDANDQQRRIKEFNTGIMALPAGKLSSWLEKLGNDNAQGEYYLTDVIELIGKKMPVQAEIIKDPSEVMGINTINQLSSLENSAPFIGRVE